MNKQNKKLLVKLFAPMVAATFAFAPVVSSVSTYAIGVDGYKAVLDYDNLDEAKEAAALLNEELTAEGAVLLKNDGTLPLDEGSWVTVFGSAATSMQGASGSITVPAALELGGFRVNPTVITEAAAEDLMEQSIGLYRKAAVVVLKRGGGEGSDLSCTSKEEATEEENVGGWEHQQLAVNAEGKEMKHNLMLTNAEIKMIEAAKATCEKVVVLLNTSNVMEMYNLDQDEEINAIMHIGRPGANGVRAVGKLLSGEYNPSGKTVDEWYKDFSADPTWYNFGSNVQNDAGSNTYILENGTAANKTGFHGIDYEEDIYLGYKYYETVYAEILAGNLKYEAGKLANGAAENKQANADAWYADNVVYPFGYGLSYADFDIEVMGISKASFTAAELSSAKGDIADEKTVTVTVKVTNTSSYASGKETVQIYAQAPYTVGGIEKAAVNMVAFAKTENLRPGQSQTLKIQVNMQDISSYDYADANGNGFKGYELEEGTYTLFASNTSHCTAETAYAQFEVEGDAKLGLDDFSDNEAFNIYSKENGRYYSLRRRKQ